MILSTILTLIGGNALIDFLVVVLICIIVVIAIKYLLAELGVTDRPTKLILLIAAVLIIIFLIYRYANVIPLG